MSKKCYPVRVPRCASGIRAQEMRTGAGRNWWFRRWQQVLEGMGLGARLGRGKNYAISGQVTEMRIEGPHVEARVVGTRAEPYRVTIDFRIPEGEARAHICAALRREPMLVARLLADDLPTTRCSCPDYANPCKHSSAVLILLGEEIARRPSTLLDLRGIPMEELYED